MFMEGNIFVKREEKKQSRSGTQAAAGTFSYTREKKISSLPDYLTSSKKIFQNRFMYFHKCLSKISNQTLYP